MTTSLEDIDTIINNDNIKQVIEKVASLISIEYNIKDSSKNTKTYEEEIISMLKTRLKVCLSHDNKILQKFFVDIKTKLSSFTMESIGNKLVQILYCGNEDIKSDKVCYKFISYFSNSRFYQIVNKLIKETPFVSIVEKSVDNGFKTDIDRRVVKTKILYSFAYLSQDENILRFNNLKEYIKTDLFVEHINEIIKDINTNITNTNITTPIICNHEVFKDFVKTKNDILLSLIKKNYNDKNLTISPELLTIINNSNINSKNKVKEIINGKIKTLYELTKKCNNSTSSQANDLYVLLKHIDNPGLKTQIELLDIKNFKESEKIFVDFYNLFKEIINVNSLKDLYVICDDKLLENYNDIKDEQSVYITCYLSSKMETIIENIEFLISKFINNDILIDFRNNFNVFKKELELEVNRVKLNTKIPNTFNKDNSTLKSTEILAEYKQYINNNKTLKNDFIIDNKKDIENIKLTPSKTSNISEELYLLIDNLKKDVNKTISDLYKSNNKVNKVNKRLETFAINANKETSINNPNNISNIVPYNYLMSALMNPIKLLKNGLLPEINLNEDQQDLYDETKKSESFEMVYLNNFSGDGSYVFKYNDIPLNDSEFMPTCTYTKSTIKIKKPIDTLDLKDYYSTVIMPPTIPAPIIPSPTNPPNTPTPPNPLTYTNADYTEMINSFIGQPIKYTSDTNSRDNDYSFISTKSNYKIEPKPKKAPSQPNLFMKLFNIKGQPPVLDKTIYTADVDIEIKSVVGLRKDVKSFEVSLSNSILRFIYFHHILPKGFVPNGVELGLTELFNNTLTHDQSLLVLKFLKIVYNINCEYTIINNFNNIDNNTETSELIKIFKPLFKSLDEKVLKVSSIISDLNISIAPINNIGFQLQDSILNNNGYKELNERLLNRICNINNDVNFKFTVYDVLSNHLLEVNNTNSYFHSIVALLPEIIKNNNDFNLDLPLTYKVENNKIVKNKMDIDINDISKMGAFSKQNDVPYDDLSAVNQTTKYSQYTLDLKTKISLLNCVLTEKDKTQFKVNSKDTLLDFYKLIIDSNEINNKISQLLTPDLVITAKAGLGAKKSSSKKSIDIPYIIKNYIKTNKRCLGLNDNILELYIQDKIVNEGLKTEGQLINYLNDSMREQNNFVDNVSSYWNGLINTMNKLTSNAISYNKKRISYLDDN